MYSTPAWQMTGTGDSATYFTGLSGALIGWTDRVYGNSFTGSPVPTLSIGKNSPGVMEINNGTAGTFRDLKLRNLIGSTIVLDATSGNLIDARIAGSTKFSVTSGGALNIVDVNASINLRETPDGAIYCQIYSYNMRAHSSYAYLWTNGSYFGDTVDTGVTRSAAGVVEVNNGTQGNFRFLKARGLGRELLTVGTLPAASAYSGFGCRVSDASLSVTAGNGTVVAGGGGNKVNVTSDGTNWIIE